MRRAAARFAPGADVAAHACRIGFGSMLLPYGANLYGHALAAVFAFGAWFVLDRRRAHATDGLWSRAA